MLRKLHKLFKRGSIFALCILTTHILQTSIRVTDNLVARWSLVNFIRNSHYVGDGVLLNWTKDYEATPQDGPENKISCQQEYNSFTLQSNRQQKGTSEEPSCKRKRIVPPESCEQMKEMVDMVTDECKKFKENQLCTVNKMRKKFNCLFAVKFCSKVFIGQMDWEAKLFLWSNVGVLRKLENKLESLAEEGSTFLLKCHLKPGLLITFARSNHMIATDGSIVQAFWFFKEPSLERNQRSSTGNLSVSVLFLDSMSRTLAFRSLPRTIKFLQKLAKDSKRKVFDFKLFQSIADSTYWHLSNLFDGPKATAQNKFFYIEKSANFFRKFKQEGFQTSYSWDICYRKWYLTTKFGQAENWRQFAEASTRMRLDNIGLAEVTCELLEAAIGGKHSQFSQLQKCFNGKQYFGHQLQHVMDLQKFWMSRGQKFVTFLETNINHNDHLAHSVLLDSYLQEYLKEMMNNRDVMFVIFSDHGNKFATSYIVDQAPEGATDQYHPFLFVVLPENESRYFGINQLKSLHINQNRLLTVRDLHFLFAKFWSRQKESKPNYNSTELGILGEISAEKTCEHLNYCTRDCSFFCICENLHPPKELPQHEVPKLTRYIENRLNSQIDSLRPEIAINERETCRNVSLSKVESVPISYVKETRKEPEGKRSSSYVTGLLEMDHSSGPVIFSVYLEWTKNDDSFFSFERVDRYSRFEDCTPPGWKDQRLCICE